MSLAERAVADALDDWRRNDKTRHLWERDARLWTNAGEERWLGWLDVVERVPLDVLARVAADVRAAGFERALLLGMGGSSLCPEVLSRVIGPQPRGTELLVLDSTVPAQVLHTAQRCVPERTLCIVASKSGSTVEPNAFKAYFYARARQAKGAGGAGQCFAAITDPGTTLHQLAAAEGFRHIVHGEPSIGGRYSALSAFGLLPAAILGIDVRDFVGRAREMVSQCGPDVPPENNPGVRLGVTIGVLARAGRDKLTLVAGPGLESFGAWVEQLVAESSGKSGAGIVPVDGESVAAPDAYDNDRVFVYLRPASGANPHQDAAVDALQRAEHPVVRVDVPSRLDLGQEFFRWEMATAVACAVLGVNAFDQPDVEASKVATRRLTADFEASGTLAAETPFFAQDGIALFASDRDRGELEAAGRGRSLRGWLGAHVSRLQRHDYFAINAFVDMNDANVERLQAIRHRVRDAHRAATTLGFGPRFLHSTGQLHKGGPNTGVFLHITADDAQDVLIPGQRYGFGVLARFQAQGDLEVLTARERRTLRVHLGPDVAAGLAVVHDALRDALRG